MFYIWFEVYVVYNLILQSEYSTIYCPPISVSVGQKISQTINLLLGLVKSNLRYCCFHTMVTKLTSDQGNSALLVPLINFFLRKMIIMR